MGVPDSQLLTIFIKDAPEVTRHVQSLMRRIETQESRIDALTAENEHLAARAVALEAVNGAGDAASLSRASANAYINRH